MGLAKSFKLALMASVSMGVISVSVEAQETQYENTLGIRLLRIVKGAGQDKVAINTPQAVTVIGQDEIDQLQAATIGGLIRDIPGVNSTGSGSFLGQGFTIRGIGAPENAGQEGRVIVNVDGVNKYYEQYRMGGFFSETELYKKVEVLRGPASSTLYGSGALGGVINFDTKDASDFLAPGQDNMLKLKTSYNSNKKGVTTTAIWAQKLAENTDLLVTGNFRRSDNFVDGNGVEVTGTEGESYSGLAKLTHELDDGAGLKFSYQQWDSNTTGQNYVQTQASTGFGTVDRHVIDKTATFSYSNPFEENDLWDIKLTAGYSNITNQQRNASGVAPRFSCSTSVLFCDVNFGYETYQAGIENTAEFSGDNWENFLTMGYQFYQQDRVGKPVSGAFTNINYHPEGQVMRNAIFFQNEYVWNDQLTLIPGLRVENQSLKPGATIGISGTENHTAWSPKLAAHYKLNDQFSLFGSLAHTERLPSLDEVFSTGGSNITFGASRDISVEKSNNIELGASASFEGLINDDDVLQIKGTAFHNKIKDLIARNPNTPSPGFGRPAAVYTDPGYININNAVVYGFELEAAYDAGEVFGSLGFAYTVGKNTDTNDYLKTIAPTEITAKLGRRIEERGLEFGWKGRFVFDPLDECRATNDGSNMCGGGSFRDTRYSAAFNVHDLFLTWKPQEGKLVNWEMQAGLDNVFDTNYKEFLSGSNAKGRTFKLSLSKEF